MGLVVRAGAQHPTPYAHTRPIATDLQPSLDNGDKSTGLQFVRASLSLRRISWDSPAEP